MKQKQDVDIDIGAMLLAAHKDRSISDTDAGRRLGVSARYLRQLRAEGTGPAYVRFGRRVVYRVADLDAFANANRVVPTGEAPHV